MQTKRMGFAASQAGDSILRHPPLCKRKDSKHSDAGTPAKVARLAGKSSCIDRILFDSQARTRGTKGTGNGTRPAAQPDRSLAKRQRGTLNLRTRKQDIAHEKLQTMGRQP